MLFAVGNEVKHDGLLFHRPESPGLRYQGNAFRGAATVGNSLRSKMMTVSNALRSNLMDESTLVVGGLLSHLLTIKYDGTKVLWDKVDAGGASILDGFEPGVITPGNFDAIGFEALKSALHDAIARMKASASGPLVVGAAVSGARKRHHTEEEVKDEMVKAGLDHSGFAPIVLIIAQFIPLIIDMIKWLRSRKQPA